MTSRKDSKIIAEIADQLKPWKKGKTAAEINSAASQHIVIVRKVAEHMNKQGSAAQIRETAEDARRALSALERVLPGGFYDIDFAHVRKRVELLTKEVKGRATQFDDVGWLCANQAAVLVTELSANKPVTFQQGNVHNIAQLISEAVTGTIPKKDSTQLLRAVKAVAKWRQDIHRWNSSRENSR
jgi:hypothetical protein